MKKLLPQNYPDFFQKYINQVNEEDLKPAFKNQKPAAELFFKSISNEFSNRRYAEGKWTVKEVLQHIIDAERVFAYRALCIARKEANVLPPFDENNYAENSNASGRNWQDLIDEFVIVRRSTEYLFESFTDEALNSVGKVSNYTIGVSALGFVAMGHVNHHIRIIKERYIGG